MNTIITKKLLIALTFAVLSLFSNVAAAQDTASTTSVISKSELEAIIERYYGYIFSDEKPPTLDELRPSWVTAALNDASRGTSVPTLESLRRDVEQRVNEGASGDSNRGDMTWLDLLVQWFREWIQRIFGHVSSVTSKGSCGTVVSSWYDRV